MRVLRALRDSVRCSDQPTNPNTHLYVAIARLETCLSLSLGVWGVECVPTALASHRSSTGCVFSEGVKTSHALFHRVDDKVELRGSRQQYGIRLFGVFCGTASRLIARTYVCLFAVSALL
uniref:Transmembrane protein n=1 Tax=Ascaris lumbricoides TaxID=6252 RepID=A0A0M3I1R3_ASCLU